MTDGSAALLANAPLDPKKLPNYVYGMVLGPSDFRQVLENFDWKHRNANLLLHGAGTVCGLKVSPQWQRGGTDVEIGVGPGFAISPRGRWIRIDQDQCAGLNQWLQSPVGSLPVAPAPGAHKAYVTLCYSQCLTDLVPIAGQQCAPDSSNRAPSRILETFKLQFSWTPPEQPFEDRARLFGELMRRIVIVDPIGSLPTADDSQALLDAVRALAGNIQPTVASLPGSLPVFGPIHLASADADATIRQAMTLWVTEVCPSIRVKPESSLLVDHAIDDCLLLAALDFTVGSNGQLNLPVDSHGNLLPSAIVIDESERPVLAPTRILQELFPTAGGVGSAGQEVMTDTLVLQPTGAQASPTGTWPPGTTVQKALPAYVPPDAMIELSIESLNPTLDSTLTGRNVVLTLVRPAAGSLPTPLSVAGTYLSASTNFISAAVRWRWYRG